MGGFQCRLGRLTKKAAPTRREPVPDMPCMVEFCNRIFTKVKYTNTKTNKIQKFLPSQHGQLKVTAIFILWHNSTSYKMIPVPCVPKGGLGINGGRKLKGWWLTHVHLEKTNDMRYLQRFDELMEPKPKAPILKANFYDSISATDICLFWYSKGSYNCCSSYIPFPVRRNK